MTVLAGFLPGKGGRAGLELAAQMARSGTREPVVVTTVVPQAWSTPSMAKVDAEYAAWAQDQGRAALELARTYLAAHAPDIEVEFRQASGRSVGRSLLSTAQDCGADLIILGSSARGRLGHVVVGATAEPLVHSSPLPIALAPRGYRAPGATIERITCAFSGTDESLDLLAATAGWSSRLRVPLRVATFAVRGRTMVPTGVGLHAEDTVLAQWREQSEQAQTTALQVLQQRCVEPTQVLAEIGVGRDWDQALDALSWVPGEVLVVGSKGVGPIARVFLGSRAIKIVRHAPVPVLVVPGAAVAEEVFGQGPQGV